MPRRNREVAWPAVNLYSRRAGVRIPRTGSTSWRAAGSVSGLGVLIGAPFGMRAMSHRPCGPSNALCSWFARFARSRRALLLGLEAGDVRDGALALVPPPDADAHAGPDPVGRAGVQGVEDAGGG